MIFWRKRRRRYQWYRINSRTARSNVPYAAHRRSKPANFTGSVLQTAALSWVIPDYLYSNGNLTYYVQNVDENYAVSEGHVRLIVRSGNEITYRDPIFSSEDDLGSEILSGETRPHTDVSFKTEEGDEPLFIEYYGDGNAPDGASNFWDEERHDDSLYWKA